MYIPPSWAGRDHLGLVTKCCLPGVLRCESDVKQALQILWSLPSTLGVANSLVPLCSKLFTGE